MKKRNEKLKIALLKKMYNNKNIEKEIKSITFHFTCGDLNVTYKDFKKKFLEKFDKEVNKKLRNLVTSTFAVGLKSSSKSKQGC